MRIRRQEIFTISQCVVTLEVEGVLFHSNNSSMSDLLKSLREEIRRHTKKTIRESLAKLQKNSAQHRRDIAKLKRELEACRKRIEFLERQEKKRIGETTTTEVENVRFSAKSVRSHRTRLGLSAGEYGKLLSVSAQTVYQWEQSKTRPRKKQIAQLVELRSLGKKEAKARLRLLESESPKAK